MLGDGLSGFDLGRGLLNALLFEEDGRGEKTVLTSLFEERVGENIRAHLKKVYEKGKAYIASFSDLVFKGIELEDKVAKGILQEAIKEFETSLHTAYRLMEQEKCEVALFGGLTKQFEKINAFFAQETKEKFIFTIPQNPIVYGLLKEFIPKEEREEFKKNLRVGYYENR